MSVYIFVKNPRIHLNYYDLRMVKEHLVRFGLTFCIKAFT